MFGTTRIHWYQYLATLVVVLGVAPAFLFVSYAQEESESGFSVSPTEYDVTISSLEPVVVEFTLINPFAEELGFNLGVEESNRQVLVENGVELTYLPDGAGVDILNETTEIRIAGGSQETVLIEIKPTAEKDFEITSIVTLVQTESERNLQQTKYDLELNIASKVAASKKAFFTESIAGGLVVLGVIIAGLIFLFKPDKQVKNGQKSDQ